MSDKPQAEQAGQAPAKSKKMLLIVVAVVVLAVLGGGGMLYMSKKNAALGEEDEEVATEHAVPAAPPVYMPLDTMVVNLADPGGERVAQIGVVLELADDKASERVKPYLPSIRNDILLLMSQRTAEELLRIEGKEKLAADILVGVSRHFEAQEEPEEASSRKRSSTKKRKVSDNPVRGVLFSSLIVQ